MIQVRVAQQSAVSVRIAGAAPVKVDVTGTAVVGAPEYTTHRGSEAHVLCNRRIETPKQI